MRGKVHIVRRALAVAFVAVLLPGLASISGAAEESPFVVLKVKEPVTKLGQRFRVRAIIHNPSQERILHFIFHVSDASGTTVPFENWVGGLAADGKASFLLRVTTAQWFADPGRFKITISEEDGHFAGEPLSFVVERAPVPVPRFEDVTTAAGLRSENPDYLCGRWALGAAWGDVDDDGDLDLFLPHPDRDAELMINDGTGHFQDEASARGVSTGAAPAAGATFADYDNDGDQDLYVTIDGADRLFRNDGAGTFADVSAAAGIGDEDLNGTSSSWADYDDDGFLDLYVANYARCTGTEADRILYHSDRLYHNEGDGTFSDQTALLEHDPSTRLDGSTIGAGFQASWFDYDNDGDVDLFLGNDFWNRDPDKNHLWRNDGQAADGTWQFTDVSQSSRMGVSMNTMGAAVGDYDRDGDTDLALSDIEKNRLFRNEGDGTFTDVAPLVGVGRTEQRVSQKAITWGMGFFDFNLDRWEDLYVAAAPLQIQAIPQPNELFVGNGRGRFLDLSAPSGANDPISSRGIAFADYDRDGRVDMLVANHLDTVKLWRNVTPTRNRHWLELELEGTTSNRDACGARVDVWIDGDARPIPRQVLCGSMSFVSGSDKVLHFGLGTAETVKRIEIRWPSGTSQVVRDVDADQLLRIAEPG